MVILCHSAGTLAHRYGDVTAITTFYVDIAHSTRDFSFIVVTLIRYLGYLADDLFFICSAWFLCNSKTIKLHKLLEMLLTVWFCSLLFFIPYSYFNGIHGLNLRGIMLYISKFVSIKLVCYNLYHVIYFTSLTKFNCFEVQ